jgi:hypothetical protein
MNSSVLVIVLGSILLYFIDSAFKFSPFHAEMFVHSSLRFIAGFLILGIGVFYAHKIKLKYAICLLLALTMADDIWDYSRNVNSFSFEVMLHGIYMLSWGAVTGYVVMKRRMDRDNRLK